MSEELHAKIAALEAGNESLRLVRDEYKRQADEYRAKWAALTTPPSPDAELVDLLESMRAFVEDPLCHQSMLELIDAKLASLKGES
jgi:hypothetical protein